MKPKPKTKNMIKRFVSFIKRNAVKATVIVGVAAGSVSNAFAAGSLPLDMDGTGSTIAGYIFASAGAGLAVLAGLYGVRVIIRAFKSVK